jgi:hypothetical protein
VAKQVQADGFEAFKQSVIYDPEEKLRRLAYVGPVTVWHLAKNLGMNTAKPDRHLERIALRLGFGSSFHFCNSIAEMFDDECKVVDLIVWRYFADNPHIGRELLKAA